MHIGANVPREMYQSPEGSFRKKRRPALACEQCRRKKIKCDRQTPCQPCSKAGVQDCTYVHDHRNTVTVAPFEKEDVQFSVFEQTNQQFTAPNTAFQTHNRSRSNSSPTNLSLRDLVQSTAFQQIEDSTDMSDVFDCPDPKTPQYETLDATANTSWPMPLFKARFYGQSHWTHSLYHSPEVLAVIQSHEANKFNYNYVTFTACKAMSKKMKSEESMSAQTHGHLRDLVPTQTISDRLTQAYLRTFQTVIGMLYVPSFREDYKTFWEKPEFVSESFVVTLLLVMCIGSTFIPPEAGISRVTALQCLNAAASWLGSLEEKTRLDLGVLRIRCLFLTACQCKSVNSSIAWLSASSLVRIAMQMGIHIDPAKHTFSSIPTSEIEARRRLWATVLEIEVQSCMDYGCLPSINIDHYNCALPSNIDDASLEGGRHGGSDALQKPLEQLTQSSIQILLMKTLPARLKIVNFINSVRAGNTFEQALDLSVELSEVLKSCQALIEGYRMSSTPPTAFQTKSFDLLVQRFLLGLHQSLAVKAVSNPSYNYSRQVYLETCFSLFAHSPSSGDDDFYRLRLQGMGIFRDVHTQSALYMCRELMSMQLDRPFLTPCNIIIGLKEIRRFITEYLDLSKARIAAGERKIKCYVLVSCLLAQADAMQKGASVELKILTALKTSLETSYSFLKSQMAHLCSRSEITNGPAQPSLPMPSINQQPQLNDLSQWDDLIAFSLPKSYETYENVYSV